ncbi:hypothetical protein RO787_21020 [Blautia coccoides]|uniref:hypothetical protein n=1 Tax=Blautia producta TaxID=33035 RepID=UPI0028A50F37|nr:hypothetical protein [Blautia coccoides]MDT4375815.1 hypothetical protein [Blautia coccoides]
MVEELSDKIEDIILQVISQSENYIDASYYSRHCIFPMWRYFSLAQYLPPPYFIRNFCNEIETYIANSRLTSNDIINYFAKISLEHSGYFWVSQCIIKHGLGIKDDLLLYNLAAGESELDIHTAIPNEMLAFAFAAFILDFYPHECSDFEQLILNEHFEYPINDYKLSKLTDVEFKQDGLLFDNKYHLYSRFIDRSPFDNGSSIPAIFYLLIHQTDFNKADFFMRLDARLSIPVSEFDGHERVFAVKYYGPTFSFSETDLSRVKTFIVHGNPESGNQLLMVIKKDFDSDLNLEFWHIELETLPFYQNSPNIKRATTTFIHGKYYPTEKVFRHIDFIKNQYAIDDYCKKYIGSTAADRPIDFYTTKECHFKIWCIENINLSENLWHQISSICLSDEYSTLLDEMLQMQ